MRPSSSIAWLRTADRRLLALALVIGLGGGVGAVAFRELIIGITRLATGHRDYAGLGRVPSGSFPFLGVWFLLVVPVVGGLVYGPLLARFAPEARGHGVPEVMLAVAREGGRIRPRVALVKALASAACIGTGGSVGREGPIVQIGSALGSALGQLCRLRDSQLRLLVACGAAAGISATFNTPIAGAFFAMEVILRRIEASSFGLVVVASVAADAIGRWAFGDTPFLTLPAVHIKSAADYGLFAGLGVLATFAGIGFTRILYAIEDLGDRVWHGPPWARPAVGGLVLGGLLLALPELYGVGYPVLSDVVDGHRALLLVVVLMAGKAVATSTTIAIGGSGGVFAPSLFIGAMLGSAYGRVAVSLLGGSVVAPASAYGVIGMGAVFAACARAPMTAVLILFELTGDNGVILPAMLAIVVSTALANAITEDTIYTLKLRRRGIDIDAAAPIAALAGKAVSEPLRPGPDVADDDSDVADLLDDLAQAPGGVVALAGDDGEVTSVLRLADCEVAMGDDRRALARDLAVDLPTIQVGDPLQAALEAMTAIEVDALPILTEDGCAVAGYVTSLDILRAFGPSRSSAATEDGASTARAAVVGAS